MSESRILCAVCAARTMMDLNDTTLQLVCTDARSRKARCDSCEKERPCMGYAIRMKEVPPDGV